MAPRPTPAFLLLLLAAAPVYAAPPDCSRAADGTHRRACQQLNQAISDFGCAITPQARAAAQQHYIDTARAVYTELGPSDGDDDANDFFAPFDDAFIAVGGRPWATPDDKDPAKDKKAAQKDRAIKPEKPPNPLTDGANKDLAGGNPAEAVKKLDQALGQNQNDPDALELRARAKAAQGDSAGALADAKRAQALGKNDPEMKALISGLEGAARAADKLKKTKLDFGAPKDADGGSGGRAQAGGGAGTARTQGAAGGPAQAPGGVPAGEAVGGAVTAPGVKNLTMRAEKLIDIGDLTGAMLPLREAIDLDPKNPLLWDELADVSNKLGNPEGALDAAKHALALNPDDARALRAKAYAEIQLGHYAEALADAERAIALEPGSGLGHLYRAMALEKLGRSAEALEEYRTAVRLDPTLAPLADPALKRLGGAAPRAGGLTPFRLGALALSTVLVVLGLMGTATGRKLTEGAKRLITPLPPREGGSDSIRVGDVVGGHYRVTRELGRGGMGVVYEAQDETLRRPVAIKRLQREIRDSAEDLDRFLREARLVAQLKHPHLAQIFGVIDERDVLLVFEYVDGEPLDRILLREKRLAPARARAIVAQTCDALQYAHERRIVHRDLKPSNVMLDAGGVKVMDFGIAHQARGPATMTRTSISGTPPYMAPEQGFGSVSKASDLYALGVMTYEMLTGVRPFDGPDYVEPKLRGEYVRATARNPSLPPGVDEFLARALAPDPLKRPADAAAFALEFGRALDATPSKA